MSDVILSTEKHGQDTYAFLFFMHGFSVEDTPRFARGGIDTARGGS